MASWTIRIQPIQVSDLTSTEANLKNSERALVKYGKLWTATNY
jgi:hypothetical protein